MKTMNNTSNTTSERYPLLLKTLGSIWIMPGAIGMAANTIVILAVFGKNTTLKRNTCTILLGILAMEEFIVSTHYFQSALTYFFAWTWHPQLYCYLTQIPSIYAFLSSSFMMLSIAMDRWLSLQFPVRYRNWNKKKYLSFTTGVSVVYGVGGVIAGGITSSVDLIVPICTLATGLNKWAQTFWLSGNLTINFFVILLFTAAYLRVKISGLSIFKDEAHMKREKRLLKSMVILGIIYTFCWLTPTAIVVTLHGMKVGESTFFHGSALGGTLSSINASCNFFVYFARSKEYRDEFMRLLGKKNAVAVQPAGANEARKRAIRGHKVAGTSSGTAGPSGTAVVNPAHG